VAHNVTSPPSIDALRKATLASMDTTHPQS
jgi:hypothetical protein